MGLPSLLASLGSLQSRIHTLLWAVCCQCLHPSHPNQALSLAAGVVSAFSWSWKGLWGQFGSPGKNYLTSAERSEGKGAGVEPELSGRCPHHLWLATFSFFLFFLGGGGGLGGRGGPGRVRAGPAWAVVGYLFFFFVFLGGGGLFSL